MASSPPPKGSKRERFRDAARHSYNRFKHVISPPTPQSGGTAAPLAGPSSSSAPPVPPTGLTAAQPTTPAQASPAGQSTGPSTANAGPAPPPTATQTGTVATPGPNAAGKLKGAGSVAWAGLETTLRRLEKSADVFPPLKSAVGGFIDCLDVVREAAASRDDYEQLVTELTTMAGIINEHAAELGSDDAGSSATRIVLSIEAEITQIRKQQSRDMGRRIIESTQVKEDVIKRYQRVEMLFRQLQSDVGLRAWKTVDKQFKMLLLERMSPADDAIYNSGYSTIIKRRGCTAETREKVQADLQDWVRDPNGAKVYWMNGMAGTGKTTIAYSLSEWLEANQLLGASFFCSRSSSSCRNVNQIVPTIAYQLAQYSPAFRSALCKTLEEKTNASKLNAVWQFKKLVQVPLEKVTNAIPENLVVVIDALDECEDVYGVRLVLETLLKFGGDLPIKFFVTSRPEPTIREKMLSPDGFLPSVLHLHDIEESIVGEDIKKYLIESLSPMSSPPSPDDIEQLAKLAGKLFIFAATAVRYILPTDRHVNSNARLKAVLATVSQTTKTSTSNIKYKDLDALYTNILSIALDSEQLEAEEIDVIQLVLRTVVCAQEPMTIQTLSSLLGVTEEEVSAAVEPLRSVLDVSEAGGLVSTLHASFSDFIFDKTRSREFYCDRVQHNEHLANRCFDVMNEQLHFNICNLQSSCEFDKDVPDLEERIKANISPALFYACRYWGAHLQLGGASDELCRKLVDLLTNRLLFWMEVLNLEKCIVLGPDIMLQAQDWLLSNDVAVDAKSLATDAQLFVTRFATGACKRSTPHIYLSALPFCPRSSTVYKNYWGRTRGVIEVKGAAIGQRETAPLVTWVTDAMIRATAFSPDGTRIVSGSDDGAIRVWDARTSDIIAGPLEGHSSGVNSVSFFPDSARIVSGSDDRTIRVWDVRTGERITGPLEGHSGKVLSVALSPEGTRIASASDDCTIRLWDAQTGHAVAKPFEGHTDGVNSVSFSPDGARLVSGSDDNTILIWDVTTGDVLAGPFKGHTGIIWAVAFSPDGTRIASGSSDCTVRVWDGRTGDLVSGPFEGRMDKVYSVAFSPDSSRIVSGSRDQTIQVWDINSSSICTGVFEGHTDMVLSVAFSPDGTRIVSGSIDRTIRVWDARPGHTASEASQGHRNTIYSVSFSPDGLMMVSGSDDRTIRVWDALTGDAIMKFHKLHTGPVPSVAFSPDGSRIASASTDQTIRVWGAHSGDTVAGPFNGHSAAILSVVFSPDGTQIVSGSEDRTIRVWNAHTGEPLVGPLKGHTAAVRSVALSPDGTRIVSGSFDYTLRTWDSCSGAALTGPLEGHTYDVWSVAYSPDGNLIVSGSGDHTIRLWSAHTGAASAEPFRGHTSIVISVAFSPDSTLIVSGSGDHTLRLWNTQTGETLAGPFQGHTSLVYSVAFSLDGSRIISGSHDYVIRVWDAYVGDALRQAGRSVSTTGSNAPAPTHNITRLDGVDNVQSVGPMPPNLISMRQTRIHQAFAGTEEFTSQNDGWITSDDIPLLWTPPDFLPHLPHPRNTLVIGPHGSACVDYRNLMIGEQWVKCYVSE